MTSSKWVDTLVRPTTMRRNSIHFLHGLGRMTLWCLDVVPANYRVKICVSPYKGKTSLYTPTCKVTNKWQLYNLLICILNKGGVGSWNIWFYIFFTCTYANKELQTNNTPMVLYMYINRKYATCVLHMIYICMCITCVIHVCCFNVSYM